MLVAGLGAGVALADEPEAVQQIQNATTPQESESPQPTEDTGGTTIDLFDYWTDGRDEPDDNDPSNYQNLGINAGHVLKFGKGGGRAPIPVRQT